MYLTAARRCWMIGGVLALTLLLYMPAVRYPFLPFDDDVLVTKNPITHGLTRENIHAAFTTFDPELYIPLTFLSFQTDYAIAGLNPAQYHATNIVLHLLNVLLVFAVLRALLKNDALCLFLAAVFALHPVNVETVTWVSARKDLLAATFGLASLVMYIKYVREHERLWYILSVFCFLLALLSKVSVALLPVALMIVGKTQGHHWKRVMGESVPFCILTAAFAYIAFMGKVEGFSSLNLWQIFLMATQNTTITLSHFLYPVNLSILYPWTATPISILVPRFAAGVAGSLGIFSLFCFYYRKNPLLSAGIAFFVILLLPSALNLYKFDSAYLTSDRYGYFAMTGLLLAAGTFLAGLCGAGAAHMRKKLAATGAGAVLFTLLFLSWQQLSMWRNDLRFFSSTIARYPDSYIAHNNLGNAYANSNMGTGALLRALAEFEEANRLKPGMPRIQMNIASTEALLGRHADAEQLFLAQVATNPKDAEAWFRLGNFYASRQQKDKALAAYKTSLELNPAYVTEAFEQAEIQH